MFNSSDDYRPESRALMRLQRDAYLDELKAQCDQLEQGTSSTDTWLGIFGGIATVAGALVMPGLGFVIGATMLGAAVGKGMLSDASIERACSDIPIKELEQKMEKKFNEVNRKLDQQAEILKGISEKVSETLSKLEDVRQQMNAGFERILTAITAQDIGDKISDIDNARTSIAFSEDAKREASKEQFINIIEQEIRDNFLFDYVKQHGTLFGALFSIINKRYAIPSNINDENAYNALSGLNYGTLTYSSIVFSLLDQYAYISEYYYQTNELEKFNSHLDKLLFYFNTFKRILNTNRSGLIDKVIALLEGAKNSHNMRGTKGDLYNQLEGQIATLRKLKQDINGLSLPVIDRAPENDVTISFNFYPGLKRSATPFLNWRSGVKVSYALQFESDGKYSKISKWSAPQEVMNIANPDVELRNFNSMNRLVFRKFDNNPPELIRVVSGSKRSFRDVDRDLYDLASVESYQNNEIVRKMTILKNMGANLKAVFENNRNVIHAAAAAGRVALLEKILDLEPSLVNLKDSTGYTPLHLAVEMKKVDAVRELILRNADVNAKSNKYDVTPLHLAVRYQSEDILQSLLECPRIKPNEKDSAGMTPLHISVSDVSFDSSDIQLKLLQNSKVNPNVKDAKGLAPIHYSATLALYKSTINFLRRQNTDMYIKDNNGLTPLHYAAIRGSEGLISDLLERDRSHINDIGGEKKWTPLHYAVFYKQTEFASLYLGLTSNHAHINVNIADSDQQTPLHLAASSGQAGIVQSILNRGGKVYLKTKKQHTALDLAIMHGKQDVILKLLKAEKKQKTPSGTSAKDEDTLACGLAKGDILALLVREQRCSSKYRRSNNEEIGGNNKLPLYDSMISKFNTSDSIARNEYVASSLAENGKIIKENIHSGNRINNAIEFLGSSKPKYGFEGKSTSSAFKRADVNGALLLLDLFVRKFTEEKYNLEPVNSDEPLEARARALNITDRLRKFVDSLEDHEGQNELDFFDVHSNIYKAILSENQNKLAATLCSYLKDYSGLKQENVNRFIADILRNNPLTGSPKAVFRNIRNLNAFTCY